MAADKLLATSTYAAGFFAAVIALKDVANCQYLSNIYKYFVDSKAKSITLLKSIVTTGQLLDENLPLKAFQEMREQIVKSLLHTFMASAVAAVGIYGVSLVNHHYHGWSGVDMVAICLK